MRFILFNLMVVALLICAGLFGLLQPFLSLGSLEWSMLGALLVYGSVGAVALTLDKSQITSHVAHSLPILGLVFTGLGLLLAASQFSSIDPSALARIFHELVYAISPNVVAVGLMFWLREMAWWVYQKSI